MLSILIPTYNYDVTALVEELYQQCVDCSIQFEILVFDDGSNSSLNSQNKSIKNLNNCEFKSLEKNIGRSAIRNLLAKHSRFENLLFLDSDVLPESSNFIQNYVNCKQMDVVSGRIVETKTPPKKPKRLRWLYTKKRERSEITSANFLIKKELIVQNKFNESLKSYGYEDVFFFNALRRMGIQINTIKNPVIHLGNDDANDFLLKTNSALDNLMLSIKNNDTKAEHHRIAKTFLWFFKLGLVGLISKLFLIAKPLLIQNFNSSYPLIFLYDFYRLGYFSTLKTKK
ncbi:glycosyltransferase family 2 protein [Hyunsoonleella sp. SJ7]|uniref:Glycosyltransferase family 2 protein n=1 Tax=Hyunsoonleella aquatilis TaxID=2762758 RepID=A0A923HCB4_9FLAO|nr:glycosyltransferase family A protein [Hyunsoonleella aquatilis]MBC3757453.1 glycosyltransferase family 2 protein [Hyunsoonleella aquatilis]